MSQDEHPMSGTLPSVDQRADVSSTQPAGQPKLLVEDGREAPVAVAPVQEVGDLLRSARESKKLTLADVSQSIKISPRVLEQVENNQWSDLAGRTFARGVVRSYARLVQLDPEPLLKALESAPLPKAPTLDLPRSTDAALPVPGEAQRRDTVAMVGGILLVALTIVAYYLIPEDWFVNSVPGAPSPTKRAEVVIPSTPIDPTPVAAAPVAINPDPVISALPLQAPASVDGPALKTVTGSSGQVELSLRFEEESWVEIRDHQGAVLLSETMSAGAARKVSGTPPYALWFGNADGVHLRFRGQEIDLRPHTRQKVARFALE